MLKRRLQNILTHLRSRITNAFGESLNAKIQWVKYTARGFETSESSRASSIPLRRLDLYPPSTKLPEKQ